MRKQGFQRVTRSSRSRETPAVPGIVARVRPRTSKGITDLLLLNLVLLDAASPSKKNLDCTKDNPTI